MIRTTLEINALINRSQHAAADVANSLVQNASIGLDETDTDFRDEVYRLELIYVILYVLLDGDGNIKPYFLSTTNQKKFNKILDGLQALTKLSGGPVIPMVPRRNIPLLYGAGTTKWGDIEGDVTDQLDLVAYITSLIAAANYWRGDYDPSGGLPPADGTGSGDGGAIIQGNEYYATTGSSSYGQVIGNVFGEDIYHGCLFKARINAAANNRVDWYLSQDGF